jgi:hypothetical protein
MDRSRKHRWCCSGGGSINFGLVRGRRDRRKLVLAKYWEHPRRSQLRNLEALTFEL